MIEVPKFADLLMVGISHTSFTTVMRATLQALKEDNPFWTVTASCAPAFDGAELIIPVSRVLDVVYISNGGDETPAFLDTVFNEGCSGLAEMLACHPNKPWVNFPNRAYGPFTTVFVRAKVRVRTGPLKEAITARWEEKTSPARKLYIG